VLKAAREKLKLEIKDFAIKACLSKKHITELEQGGTSSFYSESHKILVAKKVAKMLQVDESLVLIHPDGDSIQQVSLSFDAPVDEVEQLFTAQETKAVRDIREITAEAQLIVENSNQAKIKPANKSEPSQPTKVTLENLQSGGQIDSSRPKTKRSLSGLASALLLILVAGGLYSSKNTIIALFSPPAAEPQAVVVDGAAPQDPKVDGANPANPANPTNPTSPANSSAPTSAVPAAVSVAAVPPLPSDVSCPKPDASVTEQSVTEPSKPGNFVHVHAKSRQIVCVVDATGKSMMQSIDAGTGHTYGGKAPFTILSNGLSQTSVYFQGKLVRPINEQARTMRVVEVSAN
jgi:transcriptional regulator with XRE-family HTH domain